MFSLDVTSLVLRDDMLNISFYSRGIIFKRNEKDL